MILKEGIIINEIDDGYVAIDAKIQPSRFNGMVKLNQSAKKILDLVKEETSEEELLKRFSEIENVEIEDIKTDVLDIVKQLKEIGYIVD